MGRPPFEDPALVRSEKMSITLTSTEKSAIQSAAADRDLTASTFTRQAALTDPGVVEHLGIKYDYATLHLLAHDWISRTDHMATYFEPYLTTAERRQLADLLDVLRSRVETFEDRFGD
ncbi:MAG: hypothetical protein RIT81_23765 [Deltaproteobacteria bacterium]